MLRLSLGMTRMDLIRNEHIRWTAQDEWFRHKVKKARLGHVRMMFKGV